MQKEEIRLSVEQKQYLKTLLKLGLELRHELPSYPDIKRGLEGMQASDAILKERNAIGFLIGGLSEAVWNRNRTMEELASHKDTDVMVVSEGFELSHNFEGGIDWWLPRTERLSVRIGYDLTKVEQDLRYFENGNGVVLNFGIKRENYELAPGLYINEPSWVAKMRLYEADAQVEHRVVKVEFEGDVEEKFRDHIFKKVKTAIPSYIQKLFGKQVLDGRFDGELLTYMWTPTLELFDIEVLRAINSFKEGIET